MHRHFVGGESSGSNNKKLASGKEAKALLCKSTGVEVLLEVWLSAVVVVLLHWSDLRRERDWNEVDTD